MGEANGKVNDLKTKRKFTEEEDEEDSEDKSGENGANGNGEKENGKEESKSGRSSRNSRSRSGEKPRASQDKDDKEANDVEIKKKEESVTVKRNYRSNGGALETENPGLGQWAEEEEEEVAVAMRGDLV